VSEIRYTGSNEADVRAFLRTNYGCEYPYDWVEDIGGALMIMGGEDGVLWLHEGETLEWQDCPIRVRVRQMVRQ
jgi:hypothetical protein